MKLKRTIAASLKRFEEIVIPEGELWVGYLDNNMTLNTKSKLENHYGYNYGLTYGTTNSVDLGRTNKFYGTPKSIIRCFGNSSEDSTHAFTCLVFDISEEVKN